MTTRRVPESTSATCGSLQLSVPAYSFRSFDHFAPTSNVTRVTETPWRATDSFLILPCASDLNGIKIPFLHPRKVAHDGLLRVIIPTYLSTVLIRQYSGSRTDLKERDPPFDRRRVCWGWTPRLSLRWVEP